MTGNKKIFGSPHFDLKVGQFPIPNGFRTVWIRIQAQSGKLVVIRYMIRPLVKRCNFFFFFLHFIVLKQKIRLITMPQFGDSFAFLFITKQAKPSGGLGWVLLTAEIYQPFAEGRGSYSCLDTEFACCFIIILICHFKENSGS